MDKRLLVLLIIMMATNSHAVTLWDAEKIASGLTTPWGLSYVGNNKVIVSEKSGDIGLLDLTNNAYQRIGSSPNVAQYGQGGLLDIAHSPFNPSHIYVTYAKRTPQAIETTLAMAQFDGGSLSYWQDLLVTHSGSDGGRHFGSRITFDDQFVYFSVGDRGERDNGQDQSTHAGSILRLRPDGQVPQDNPFVAQKGARGEIWSYGHRNPQGLFFDPSEKKLWSVEHGPRGGDEINLIVKGGNYGWPITSHGKEYWGPIDVGESEEKEGIVSPKKVYIPSIAPSSLVVYNANRYPELSGKLLVGALKLTHINVVTLQDGVAVTEQRLMEHLAERVRDIEVLPDGHVIFSTDSGNIYRLIRAN